MSNPFNPFPGLRPFDAEEDYLFFGREQQTAELLKLLREQRFLAVVGTSGSGKSSLVRAGLLPELQGGAVTAAGSHWEVVVLRPGASPLKNLSTSIQEADLYDPDDPTVQGHLYATLTRSGLGLVEAVRQADVEPGSNVLLVVDQFEEIFRFRQHDDESAAQAADFVELLLEATRQRDLPIYVVLTMRSDYLGDCTQFRGLTAAVNQGEYLIPRLTRSQIKMAIEGPVQVGGAEISFRLLQELLNGVSGNQDQLPILQHALMRTFDQWQSDRGDDEPMDLRHYQDVGGMEEALSRHADEVFESLEGDELRAVAETVFKALTERQADNRGIRRPTRMDTLGQIAGTGSEQIASVVDAYRSQGVTFLMPPGDVELKPETIVDISHESLMRVWRRLGRWVDEESQSAQVYQRLSETAELHRADQAGLYRGPDLQVALAWLNDTQATAAWGERYRPGFHLAIEFLQASEAESHASERAAEEQRQRELEQAKALAEAERDRAELQQRSVKRLRVLSGGVALVAVFAVIASVLAFQARETAVTNETKARNAETQATANAEEATRQQGKAETAQKEAESARDSLNDTLTKSYFLTANQFLDSGDQSSALAYLARTLRTDRTFWPAANQITSVLADSNHYLGTPFKIEMDDPIEKAGLDPTTKAYYWTLTGGRQAALWDVKNRKGIGLIAGGARVDTLTFSRDGSVLFARLLDERGKVQGFRTSDGAVATGTVQFKDGTIQEFILAEPREGVQRIVAFDVAAGAFRIMDASTGKPVGEPLTLKSSASLYHYGLVADERHMVCTYHDGTVAVWSTESGKLVFQGKLCDEPTYFSRSRGRFFAVASDSATRIGWLDTSEKEMSLKTIDVDYPAYDLGFHSHSPQMYATGNKGQDVFTTVVDLETAAPSCKFTLEGYAANGRGPFLFRPRINTRTSGQGSAEPWMVTYYTSSRVDCRDLWTGKSISQLDFSGNESGESFVTPDGLRLITEHADQSVHIWDLMTGKPIIPPIRHSLDPTLGLTDDGERLFISTEDDRKIHVWSTRTGQRLQEGHRLSLAVVASFDSLADRSTVLTRYKSVLSNGGGGQLREGESRAWRMPGGQRVFPTVELPGGFRNLAFSVDDKWIVAHKSSGRNPTSSLLDVDSLRTVKSFPCPGPGMFSDFSPDGETVAVGYYDGHIRTWDIAKGRLRVAMMAGEPVIWLRYAMNGKLIAARMDSGTMCVFDAKTGYRLHEFRGLSAFRTDVSVNGPWLAVGSMTGVSYLIHMVTGELKALSPASDAPVQKIQLSRDGNRVLSAVFSGRARVWETNTQNMLFETPDVGYYSCGAFHPDGEVIALAYSPNHDLEWGKVELWDIEKKVQLTEPLMTGGQANRDMMCFSHNGRMLALGNPQSEIYVWEFPSGKRLLKTSTGPKNESSVISIAFDHADTRLAVSSFLFRTSSRRLTMLDLPPVGQEAPTWLASLAEVVAKQRVDKNGDSKAVDASEMKAAGSAIAVATEDDPYARWGRWFMAPTEGRTASPWGQRTRQEQLERLLASRLLDELHRVLEFEPNSGLAHARIAYVRSVSDRIGKLKPHAVRHWLETAGWHADQAVELAPDSVEAWALRALVMQRGGRFDEMDKAIRKCQAIEKGHLLTAYAKALALQHHGKQEEAYQAFRAAFNKLPGVRSPYDWTAGLPFLPGILHEVALRDVKTPRGLAKAGEERMKDTAAELTIRMSELDWLSRVAVERHPSEPVAWQMRANALMLADRKDEAVKALSRAAGMSADPQLPPRQLGTVLRATVDALIEQKEFEKAQKLYLSLGIPKRSAKATSRLIALDQHYNQSLFGIPFRPRDGSTPKGRVFRRLPLGVSDFNGTSFDVRGMVRVRGRTKSANSLALPPPTAVQKIPVQQKATWLHVMHGCSFAEKISWGTPLGRYVLHYDDGTDAALPIQYGKHVVTWVNNPFAVSTRALFGWREGDFDETRTLNHCIWENPHPDKTIAAISLEAADTDNCLFLVAMTLEMADTPAEGRDALSLLEDARLKRAMVNGATDVTFTHIETLLTRAEALAKGRDDLAVRLALGRAELHASRGQHKKALEVAQALTSRDREVQSALGYVRGEAHFQTENFEEAMRQYALAAESASHRPGEHIGLHDHFRERLSQFASSDDNRGEVRAFVLGAQIPARPKSAHPSTVDLSAHYNAGLREAWLSDGSNTARVETPPLRTLEPGLRLFRGIPFDVRGVVSLSAGRKSAIPFPPSVQKIVVGKKADRLHVLHGGYRQTAAGTPVAIYRVVYENGESRDLVVRFQVDVRNSLLGGHAPDDPIMVWRGSGAGGTHQQRDTALYLASWENPAPDQAISHIDFLSTLNRVDPYLVALTVTSDADQLVDQSLTPGDLAKQAVYFAERSAGNTKRARHAEALARRAVERAPRNGHVRRLQAETFRHLGRYEDALQSIQQALELDPRSGESYRILERIQVAQGDLSDAARSRHEARKRTLAEQLTARARTLGDAQLDLTPHFNLALHEDLYKLPKRDPDSNDGLHSLVAGPTELHGVLFDLRGVVALHGRKTRYDASRAEIGVQAKSIKVGRVAQAVHFLHGAARAGEVTYDAVVAKYRVHYVDESETVIEVRNGKHLLNWFLPDIRQVPQAKLAFSIPSQRDADRDLGCYLMTWKNPKPGVAISHVDFESAEGDASPFLLGITVQPVTATTGTKK